MGVVLQISSGKAGGFTVAGSSKGPNRHPRKVTPHPTSYLGHPLPREREKVIARNSAPNLAFALSEGRGWPAPRALSSGRGTGEGSFPRDRTVTSEDVKLLLPPRQSRGISQRIRYKMSGFAAGCRRSGSGKDGHSPGFKSEYSRSRFNPNRVSDEDLAGGDNHSVDSGKLLVLLGNTTQNAGAGFAACRVKGDYDAALIGLD